MMHGVFHNLHYETVAKNLEGLFRNKGVLNDKNSLLTIMSRQLFFLKEKNGVT